MEVVILVDSNLGERVVLRAWLGVVEEVFVLLSFPYLKYHHDKSHHYGVDRTHEGLRLLNIIVPNHYAAEHDWSGAAKNAYAWNDVPSQKLWNVCQFCLHEIESEISTEKSSSDFKWKNAAENVENNICHSMSVVPW